jgi:hypothetical protein
MNTDPRATAYRLGLRLLEMRHFDNIRDNAPAAKIARTKTFIAAARYRIVRYTLTRRN